MSKLATVIHIVMSKLAIFVATTVDGRDLISTCRGRGDGGGGGGGGVGQKATTLGEVEDTHNVQNRRAFSIRPAKYKTAVRSVFDRQSTKPPCIQYSTGNVQNRCAFSIRPAKYKTAVRSVFDRQSTKPPCIQYSTGKVQNRRAFSIRPATYKTAVYSVFDRQRTQLSD